jgi:hypothetical protein
LQNTCKALSENGLSHQLTEGQNTPFFTICLKKNIPALFPGKQEEMQVNFVLILLYDSNTQAGYNNASAALFPAIFQTAADTVGCVM